MIRKLLFSIACFFLLLSFATVGVAQTVQDSSRSVKITGNFSWEKLYPQKSVYGMCETTQKTMVFIYSDISNFVLVDGGALVYPVSSTTFAGNMKKHVFCLSHPTPDFIVKNDSVSNSQTNVASFIVTANADKLTEMRALVEKTITNESTLAVQKEVTQPLPPTVQPTPLPPIPPPVTYAISWEKLTPQKIDKYPCSDSNKTIVFIYSDMKNFALQDGDNVLRPASSVLFVENIKQDIFCVEHPVPDFILPASSNGQNIQKEAAAFVVGRNKENLAEIVKLVKQTLKGQSYDSLAINLTENNTPVQAQNANATPQAVQNKSENNTQVQAQDVTFASNNLPVAQTTQQTTTKTMSADANMQTSGNIQTQQELFSELQKDESGYRIQLMAKLKSDFTPESIAKYFGIPYTIKVDYDGTWHRFTIGYFKTLGDAEATLTSIYSQYHLKEHPFVSLYKNDVRVCVFLK